jgi:hypothetical protein
MKMKKLLTAAALLLTLVVSGAPARIADISYTDGSTLTQILRPQ